MTTRSFSDLIANEDTNLTATAVGDYLLIYDASEPLDINKIKVVSIADLMKLTTETARQPMVTGQAAGDLFYASAAGVLARLAKGSPGQVLKMNAGATAPEWGGGGIVTGASSVITHGDQTNINYADVPGSSFNITLIQTSTVFLFASLVGKSHSGAYCIVTSYIDGTTGQESVLLPGSSVDFNAPMNLIQRKTGVAAGSRNLKLLSKTISGTYSLYNGVVYGIAIPE